MQATALGLRMLLCHPDRIFCPTMDVLCLALKTPYVYQMISDGLKMCFCMYAGDCSPQFGWPAEPVLSSDKRRPARS